MIKPDYDDPDLARVIDPSGKNGKGVSIAFLKHLEEAIDDVRGVLPSELESLCEESGVSQYSYEYTDLTFETQY